MAQSIEIICLSHLAWEPTLFQRPQQLMKELAARGHRVGYWGCVGRERARELSTRNLSRGEDQGVHFDNHPFSAFTFRPQPIRKWSVTRSIVQWAASGEYSTAPYPRRRLLWIYHPALLALVPALESALVVYDVMDRFLSFRASKGQLAKWESAVYRRADIIFAGGRSLTAAARQDLEKLGISKPVHCFPSGIDIEHFSRALSSDTPVAEDLQQIPSPRIGYIGAVDERINFDLLSQMAHAHPEWNIILLGPVIGEDTRRSVAKNIHFIGGRPYASLPTYLKGFDVCILPFRSTELVQYVSPTKTPEYLAAGCPVVSTYIPDVAADYGDVVAVAKTPDEFIAQIENFLRSKPAPEQLAAVACSRAATWSAIAEQMEAILVNSLQDSREDI